MSHIVNQGNHSQRIIDGSNSFDWRLHLSSFIPSFASVGQRFDYRRKNGDNSKPWENSSWRDRIPSVPGLPVSSTGVILLLCVIVFFISLIAPDFVYNNLALNPADLMQKPWTIITHMFVHAGFDHLFWNMLFLFFFGTELERRVGEGKFLGIYFLSGIVAATGQMLVSGGTLVGASGALYGVLGCLAIIAPEIRVFLFFVIPMTIRWAVVLFAVIDFLFSGTADNIAHVAHLSGLALGLIIGYVMKKRGQPSYYYAQHSF
ncbi:MAG: rhomboid family intramembrane serine protease [Methanotrichaceae archaeon]